MKKFLVGAATAAHQVEGNNIHSDYWLMEQMPHSNFTEPSLSAVDHYNRYEEDIRLLASAGLTAYRFSIEWARIEPVQGCFDEAEIEHYRNVIRCCKENGVEPVVTMMHFTSPAWLIKNGGWEDESVIDAFAKYCEYVIKQLGSEIKYVCTINEANMRLQVAAISERYRKQMLAKTEQFKKMAEKSGENAEGIAQIGMNFNSMMENMKYQREENIEAFGTENPAYFVSPCTEKGDIIVMKAHRAAKEVMKALNPDLIIGLTLSLHDVQAVKGGEKKAQKEWDDEFSHYLPYIKDDDFFGLQNYSRIQIGADGIIPVPVGAKITQMEYENYPAALENVIRRVNEEFKANGVDMPIMITENGIATADDDERQEFIKEAADGVKSCIKDGIQVIGYMYWSLLDNFEWQKGFSMTFGLISVDRSNMERKPKGSLKILGECYE